MFIKSESVRNRPQKIEKSTSEPNRCIIEYSGNLVNQFAVTMADDARFHIGEAVELSDHLTARRNKHAPALIRAWAKHLLALVVSLT